MIIWIILLAFTLGMALIILPIVFLVKFRKRLRLSSARNKRRQNLQELYESLVKKENEKPSNYKIARRLKTAGNPYGMQVFHFRLIHLCLPIVVCCLSLFLYSLKNILNGYQLPFPIIPFVLVVILSYAGPTVFLIFLAHNRREVLSEEIVKFSHRLMVCINDKIPLYYAIRRAGRTCKVLKPYVDDMLFEWMDNPRSAISNFGERIGINEVLPLTNTLLATWNAGQEQIIELFHYQIRNIDVMRDFQIKKKIEASPLRITFIILIPFLVAGALVVLPWYKNFMTILQQTF